MTQYTHAFQAVILAAGKGTRMRSKRVKVLHNILGLPMLGHPIAAALDAGASHIIPILGHDRVAVQRWLDQHPHADQIKVAAQEEQLGTGHAVFCASSQIEQVGAPYTLILSGDVPNISKQTITQFVQDIQKLDTPLGVMTAKLDHPGAYGRIVRTASQTVEKIVEAADASPSELAIDEINTGIYIAKTSFLLEALDTLMRSGTDNAQQEYYLTDLVAIANGQVQAWVIDDVAQTHGVNTRAQLAQAMSTAQQRVNTHWMREGVTFLDPSRTFIDVTATLESDITIYPDVHIEGQSHIGEDVVIESGCTIRNTKIDAGCTIKSNCYVTDSTIGQGTSIGPFAHIRPGTIVGEGCKIGNFVEIKKSTLEDGAKASHLTYLGDAHVGAKANIGAGTITCNYDGENKHQTVIGKGAFIGSNSALVAPVTVGDNAYVAAGSTITNDVPDDALGVARSRQRNIDRWHQRKSTK